MQHCFMRFGNLTRRFLDGSEATLIPFFSIVHYFPIFASFATSTFFRFPILDLLSSGSLSCQRLAGGFRC
ncbi:hypothetical protein BCR39DRAFT_525539 [Naematelia encephala]|uniref:Uncharacterized protein n=1 Tax=Naematelia encephala TaxID=71784 RepID=A0A1Y2BB92_9TREE|nr:hypothetical protein BCR39DRAFT_525539 [Naematelia encephala]